MPTAPLNPVYLDSITCMKENTLKFFCCKQNKNLFFCLILNSKVKHIALQLYREVQSRG